MRVRAPLLSSTAPDVCFWHEADQLDGALRGQQLTDAVDKGGDEQRAGNNRIQVPSFLNRYCAPDSYLDSMLLTRLSKNVYRQHLPTVDVAAKAQSHTING